MPQKKTNVNTKGEKDALLSLDLYLNKYKPQNFMTSGILLPGAEQRKQSSQLFREAR